MKLEERMALSALVLNFFFSLPRSSLLMLVPSRESSYSISSLSYLSSMSFCTFI